MTDVFANWRFREDAYVRVNAGAGAGEEWLPLNLEVMPNARIDMIESRTTLDLAELAAAPAGPPRSYPFRYNGAFYYVIMIESGIPMSSLRLDTVILDASGGVVGRAEGGLFGDWSIRRALVGSKAYLHAIWIDEEYSNVRWRTMSADLADGSIAFQDGVLPSMSVMASALEMVPGLRSGLTTSWLEFEGVNGPELVVGQFNTTTGVIGSTRRLALNPPSAPDVGGYVVGPVYADGATELVGVAMEVPTGPEEPNNVHAWVVDVTGETLQVVSSVVTPKPDTVLGSGFDDKIVPPDGTHKYWRVFTGFVNPDDLTDKRVVCQIIPLGASWAAPSKSWRYRVSGPIPGAAWGYRGGDGNLAFTSPGSQEAIYAMAYDETTRGFGTLTPQEGESVALGSASWGMSCYSMQAGQYFTWSSFPSMDETGRYRTWYRVNAEIVPI